MYPVFKTCQPTPQFAQIWTANDKEDAVMVDSLFGPVTRGSVLSYQQRKPIIKQNDITPIQEAVPNNIYPDHSKFPVYSFDCCFFPLPEHYHNTFFGLDVTLEQAISFESETRLQSENIKWHKLREKRVTSTKFKRICSRRGNYESLAHSMVTVKYVQTSAMKHGIDEEPKAAKQYSEVFGRNVYTVGFIINPSAFHLGSSPDRIVYDPEEENTFGLLEIKCPSANSVVDCKYLTFVNNKLKLKENHEYYYQVVSQMGISGYSWCDFFVKAETDYYNERIYFDRESFLQMKNKVDSFYFSYLLDVYMQSKY